MSEEMMSLLEIQQMDHAADSNIQPGSTKRRRNKGNGGIQLVGPNRYRIFYEAPKSAGSKRHQRTETVHGTRKDAQARLREILSNIDKGSYRIPVKESVSEFLQRWLRDYATANTNLRTQKDYRSLISRYLNPLLGSIPLNKLEPRHIVDMHRDLADRGLSGRTVLHAHRLLSTALTRAVRWGIIDRNSCSYVDTPKVERTEMKVLDSAGINQFLNHAKSSSYYSFLFLVFHTGLRRSEALALKWNQIDLNDGTITVTHGLHRISGHGLVLLPPKTKRSRRTIPVGEAMIEMLQLHRIDQLKKQLVAGPAWMDTGFVFTTLEGRPIGPERVTREFARIRHTAGCPDLRLHDARHSHASGLLAAGIPLPVVSERLGHAGTEITSRVYAHALPAAGREAATVWERYIEAGQESANSTRL